VTVFDVLFIVIGWQAKMGVKPLQWLPLQARVQTGHKKSRTRTLKW